MKNRIVTRVIAFCMAVLIACAPITASAASLLKKGSKGSEVKLVQTTLKELGFFTYPKATGYFGAITVTAVKRFQKSNGLTADGIVGSKTKKVLYNSNQSKGSEMTLMKAPTPTVYAPEKMGDLDWFKKVQYIFAKSTNALVTDVKTGKTFYVRRTFGSNHADVEALTKEDTAIIRKIWGSFSWERRAVVVQVGDYYMAGSMTAMPHAGVDSAPVAKYVSNRSGGYGYGQNLDAVKNNGMNGHMDIHFKNSRTHGTNVMQKTHQDMVKKAAAYIAKMKISDNSQASNQDYSQDNNDSSQSNQDVDQAGTQDNNQTNNQDDTQGNQENNQDTNQNTDLNNAQV
jgi:hypothetical protein